MMETTNSLTCLECANSAIRTVEKDSIGPRMYRKEIECDHCGQEGRVFGEYGVQDEVKAGNFKHLTDEGLEAIRENMDDFEFISYD